jgi:hypothetical protein
MFAIVFICLTIIHQTSPDQLIALLDDANLVTVSTLVKPDSIAARVQFVPQRLFQAATLINSDGKMRSTKAKATSLENAYEKFALAGKGVFTKQNKLGASAFEFVAGDSAKQGKLVLYADSSFTQPLFFIRWNVKKNMTEYLYRAVENAVMKSETVELHRDGRGTYSLTIEKTLRRKLSWQSDGNVVSDEASR